MTDQTDTPSAADKLKQALAAKKAKGQGGGPRSVPSTGGKAAEKRVSAQHVALAKPAFRKASKRG
ncbi:hypothetical protein GVN18_33335 [Pseudomonas sp. ODNR1LW]|nr:hypothetical protein [Pseudomonas sp. ODNR1LW]